MDQQTLEVIINTAVSSALDKQAEAHAEQMAALQENMEQKLDRIKTAYESSKVKQEAAEAKDDYCNILCVRY